MNVNNKINFFLILFSFFIFNFFSAQIWARTYTEKKVFNFSNFNKPALYADLSENDSITVIGSKINKKISIKAVLKAETGSRPASVILLSEITPEVIRVKDIIYIKTVRHKSGHIKQKGFFQRFQSLLSMVNDNDKSSITYIVSLPESTGIKISGSALLDTLRCNNLSGGIIVNASFKNAFLTENICPVSLRSGKEYSHFEIFQHKGPVLASGGGQINFKNIVGSINIKNWNIGETELIACSGSISYFGSGSAFFSHCSGPLRAEGRSGQIKLLNHTDSDIYISSTTGKIIVDIPLISNRVNIETEDASVVFGISNDSRGSFKFESGPLIPIDISLIPFNIQEITHSFISGYLNSPTGTMVYIKSLRGNISAIPSGSISR